MYNDAHLQVQAVPSTNTDASAGAPDSATTDVIGTTTADTSAPVDRADQQPSAGPPADPGQAGHGTAAANQDAAIPDTTRDAAVPLPLVVPKQLQIFLAALFQANDWVLMRQIASWVKKDKRDKGSREIYFATTHRQAVQIASNALFWQLDYETARDYQANQYFGVCPRYAPGDRGKSYDYAHQIRTVRCLWADLDYCTPPEALVRCEAAGLPPPTVAVNSGHGTHLYWRLDQPYLIDDVGPPEPVRFEYVKENGRSHRVSYYMDKATGEQVYDFVLSPKAEHVKDILARIASALGGDHTIDLARLMRLVPTWNRKNQKNGDTPVKCVLYGYDTTRKYPLDLFAALPERAERVRREMAIADSTDDIEALLPASNGATPGLAQTGAGGELSDDKIIEKAKSAKNGARFSRLWSGDTSGNDGDHSAADLALCMILAFWCGADLIRIDRLFRQSRLMRDKWRQRPDYRRRTIDRAIEGTRDSYCSRKPGITLAQMLEMVDLPDAPASAGQADPTTDLATDAADSADTATVSPAASHQVTPQPDLAVPGLSEPPSQQDWELTGWTEPPPQWEDQWVRRAPTPAEVDQRRSESLSSLARADAQADAAAHQANVDATITADAWVGAHARGPAVYADRRVPVEPAHAVRQTILRSGARTSLTVLRSRAECAAAADVIRGGMTDDTVAINVGVYPGRDQENCKNLNEVSQAEAAGLSPTTAVCPTCSHNTATMRGLGFSTEEIALRDQCPFLVALAEAERQPHRVVPMARAQIDFARAAGDADVVVLIRDAEDVLAPHADAGPVHPDDLDRLAQAADRVLAQAARDAKDAKAQGYDPGTAPDWWASFVSQIRAVATAVRAGTPGVIVLPTPVQRPPLWQGSLWSAIRRQDAPLRLQRGLVRMIAASVSGELRSLLLQRPDAIPTPGSPKGVTSPADRLAALWWPSVPDTTVIAMTDMDADALAATTGREVVVIVDRVPPTWLTQSTLAPVRVTAGTRAAPILAHIRACLVRHPGERLAVLLPGSRDRVAKRANEVRTLMTPAELGRITLAGWVDEGDLPCGDRLLCLGLPPVPPRMVRQRLAQHGLDNAAVADGDWGTVTWQRTTAEGEILNVSAEGYRNEAWASARRTTVLTAVRRRLVRAAVPVEIVADLDLGLPLVPPTQPITAADMRLLTALESASLKSAKRLTTTTLTPTLPTQVTTVADLSDAHSTAQVASMTALSVATVRRRLADMVDLGVVTRIGKRGGWSLTSTGLALIVPAAVTSVTLSPVVADEVHLPPAIRQERPAITTRPTGKRPRRRRKVTPGAPPIMPAVLIDRLRRDGHRVWVNRETCMVVVDPLPLAAVYGDYVIQANEGELREYLVGEPLPQASDQQQCAHCQAHHIPTQELPICAPCMVAWQHTQTAAVKLAAAAVLVPDCWTRMDGSADISIHRKDDVRSVPVAPTPKRVIQLLLWPE